MRPTNICKELRPPALTLKKDNKKNLLVPLYLIFFFSITFVSTTKKEMATLLPKHKGTSAFRSISTMFGKGIHRAAKLSSRNPIEMIAGILILSSFSYFYLFNLARNSDIFSGTTTRLYPTFVYADKNSDQFQQLTRNEMTLNNQKEVASNAIKIQLKQVSIVDKENNVLHKDTLQSILKFEHTIQRTLLEDHIGSHFGYNALCFKNEQGECFSQAVSDIFDWDTLATTDLHKAINSHSELAQSIFGNLNLNATTASSLLLSFAFNASTAYRQELSHVWEQKVATLSSSGKLVSLSDSGNGEDVFTWMFIITRNIIFRIKELIEVKRFKRLDKFRYILILQMFYIDGRQY